MKADYCPLCSLLFSSHVEHAPGNCAVVAGAKAERERIRERERERERARKDRSERKEGP